MSTIVGYETLSGSINLTDSPKLSGDLSTVHEKYPIPVYNGGTCGVTAEEARNNLHVPSN